MSLESVLEHVAAIERVLANPVTPSPALASQTAQTGGTAAPAAGEGSFAQALSQASEESAGVAGESLGANGALEELPSPETADGLYAAGNPYTGTASTAAYPYTGTASTAAYPYTGTASTAGSLTASPLMAAQEPYGTAPLLQTGGAGLETGGTAGQRIVAIAESQIGQSEQPPGSNESPAIARYRTATAGAMPGEPWCAYFASWAAHEAGDPIGSEGHGLGAVSEIWSWAQSTGRAITNGPGVVPKAGDLIVFGDEHVGIVKDVLPDGDIQTIEGNYNNQVSANVRTATEATGYVEMS